MKKLLPFFGAVLLLLAAAPAQATVPGLVPGDLIKLQNDHDPSTHEDEVVYYFDKDWQRHPFPSRKTYLSWYKDFSGVKEITGEQMAEIRLVGIITYRPGTRLVKIPSVPKTYAVEPGGVLRWIETEAVAKALYGPDWAKLVDDVPESFFVNYREGAPLTAPLLPTGTVVKRLPDGAVYVIDGLYKRRLSPSVRASLHIDDGFVLTRSDLSVYDDKGDVAEGDWNYLDTSQLAYIDTKPPPAFDFPARTGTIGKGSEQTLAAFRASSGMPLIIRRIRVTLSGTLWNGSTPNLTDLRFLDGQGQTLFGTMQLAQTGASSETLTFSGAYTMQPNAVSVITLMATPAADLAAGASFTASIDRAGFLLGDGGNGDAVSQFYPKAAFPSFTTTVK